MNCIPWIRLRIRFALGGMVMSSASSTARQDATAWTTVQTPQIRWVKAQASRGSRPCMTISMPRNWVEVAHALADPAVLGLGLDPEVTLDPGDGIDDDLGLSHGLAPSGVTARGRRLAERHRQLARSRPDLVDAGGDRVRRRRRPPPRPPARRRGGRRCSRRRTRRPRGAGRRTASWCPRSSARCSRCRDARRRWASWCRVFHWKIGQGEKVAGPLHPT